MKTLYLILLICLSNILIAQGTITDIDGNVCHTVIIGTQTWMAENLKTTKYQNGDLIPNITDNVEWKNLSTGAYCDYSNNSSNSMVYGRLYNWYVVNDVREIAPVGWHVPTKNEFSVLMVYLENKEKAGGKLKESGTAHWRSPNTGATNEVGFTAIGSGHRYEYGKYNALTDFALWWSSTEKDKKNGCTMTVRSGSSVLWTYYYVKEAGFSIRCIKDN